MGFFQTLYTNEDWDRPSLDNIDFGNIREDNANWLEREFDEQDVRVAVFNSSGEKAPGPDGVPMTFY